MKRLNPFDATKKANQLKQDEERHKKRLASIKEARKAAKKAKAARRKAYNELDAGLQESFRKAEEQWIREEHEGHESAAEEEEEDQE